MAYQSVLAALASPTRQKIYDRLRQRPHSVGELAKIARVSQPAASQHLRVLRRARLVAAQRQGTTRQYRATNEGLEELRRYVESMWDDVLRAYAAGDLTPPSNARNP